MHLSIWHAINILISGKLLSITDYIFADIWHQGSLHDRIQVKIEDSTCGWSWVFCGLCLVIVLTTAIVVLVKYSWVWRQNQIQIHTGSDKCIFFAETSFVRVGLLRYALNERCQTEIPFGKNLQLSYFWNSSGLPTHMASTCQMIKDLDGGQIAERVGRGQVPGQSEKTAWQKKSFCSRTKNPTNWKF